MACGMLGVYVKVRVWCGERWGKNGLGYAYGMLGVSAKVRVWSDER